MFSSSGNNEENDDEDVLMKIEPCTPFGTSECAKLCKNGILCYVRIWLKNYLTFNERIISFLQLTK